MISRLWEFHFEDTGRRVKWFVLAGCAFLLYAFLNVALLGREERTVTLEAVVVMGCILFAPALVTSIKARNEQQSEPIRNSADSTVGRFPRLPALEEYSFSRRSPDIAYHQPSYSEPSIPSWPEPIVHWLRDLSLMRTSIERGVLSLKELGDLQERGRILRRRFSELEDQFKSRLDEQSVRMLSERLAETLLQLKTIESLTPEIAALEDVANVYRTLMQRSPFTASEDVSDLRSRLAELQQKSTNVQVSSQTHRVFLDQLRSQVQARLQELDYEADDAKLVVPAIGRFNRLMESVQKGLRSYDHARAFRQQMTELRYTLSTVGPSKMRTDIGRRSLAQLSDAVETVLRQVEESLEEADDAREVGSAIEQFNRMVEAVQKERTSHKELVRFRDDMIGLQHTIEKMVPAMRTNSGRRRLTELSSAVEDVLKRLAV